MAKYTKVKMYKRFGIFSFASELSGDTEFAVFTPEEMEQPLKYRNVDVECSTVEQAEEFIDSY